MWKDIIMDSWQCHSKWKISTEQTIMSQVKLNQLLIFLHLPVSRKKALKLLKLLCRVFFRRSSQPKASNIDFTLPEGIDIAIFPGWENVVDSRDSTFSSVILRTSCCVLTRPKNDKSDHEWNMFRSENCSQQIMYRANHDRNMIILIMIETTS